MHCHVVLCKNRSEVITCILQQTLACLGRNPPVEVPWNHASPFPNVSDITNAGYEFTNYNIVIIIADLEN